MTSSLRRPNTHSDIVILYISHRLNMKCAKASILLFAVLASNTVVAQGSLVDFCADLDSSPLLTAARDVFLTGFGAPTLPNCPTVPGLALDAPH